MVCPLAPLHALTWDAAATFFTGVLAVGAAVYVGRKQLRLTELQVQAQKDDSDRNLALREQEVRIALLDQRIDLVEELRLIWSDLTFHGIDNISNEQIANFQRLAHRSEYLFSEAHSRRLLDVWEWISKCKELGRSASRYYDRGQFDDQKKTLLQQADLNGRIRLKLEEIVREMRHLTAITISSHLS